MSPARVGIVTLPGDTNYGNRLQNFALQEALRAQGKQVESISGLPRGETRAVKAARLASTAVSRRDELLGKLTVRKRPRLDTYVSPAARRQAIAAFSDAHIEGAPRPFESTPDFVNRYEHFVVGSDQVWNPAYTHANPEWFLSFARPEQRIAYAASIGIPEVPRYLRRRYRAGLRQITALSVREHQAARIVYDLTGIAPPVVLDPTMLLTAETWGDLAAAPTALADGGYIATFMLSSGDTRGQSSTNLSVIRDHARQRDLELIDLHDPTDADLLAMGPLQFIGALRGAELIVTDSFHAAVFAALFHRPVILSPRGAMNSRFETLMGHTGLTATMLTEVRRISDVERAAAVAWDDVDQRLSARRSESLVFLESALSAH